VIALLKALTRVPLRLLHGAATLVYLVAFHLLRWRREYTERDIANAFPERSAAERAALLRRSYRCAADTLMEAVWGFGASAEALRERVTIENPEVVQRCADAGRSVVLLTAHYANWEWLLLAAGVHFDIPIDVVYQPQRVAAVDEFFRGARSRFGSTLIPRKEFIYALMTHGAEPRAYALIADQTPKPPDPKLWLKFLHQDTAFFVGAGKIARFLDADVVYVDMERTARGRYAVRFVPLAEPPYGDGADTLIVERYAQALERAVRRDPASFLWLQKKWKYPRPAESAGTAADGAAAQ
jgi:Kdo2-lipid IVA lauroyltransferase/acyltransferase